MHHAFVHAIEVAIINYTYVAKLAHIPCVPNVNIMHAHDKTSVGF